MGLGGGFWVGFFRFLLSTGINGEHIWYMSLFIVEMTFVKLRAFVKGYLRLIVAGRERQVIFFAYFYN